MVSIAATIAGGGSYCCCPAVVDAPLPNIIRRKFVLNDMPAAGSGSTNGSPIVRLYAMAATVGI
jgi:hypothetical protein